MRSKRSQHAAFTLIELLIVIAIIAILALIAVPNFLEAQTRAKVSRVFADMRTCATGIEAYCVDWGAYPYYCGREQLIQPTPDDDGGPHYLPCSLTTPVAYLSSLSMEVFAGQNTPEGCPKIHELHYFTRQQSPAWWAGGSGGAEPPYNHEKFWQRDYGFDATPFSWYLASNGPDMWCDYAGVRIYDATNGTLSKGDLVRFGPGTGKM